MANGFSSLSGENLFYTNKDYYEEDLLKNQ
jgi:hypothetical protein